VASDKHDGMNDDDDEMLHRSWHAMRSLVGEREVGACIRDVYVVLLDQAPLMRRTPDGAKTRSRKSWYEPLRRGGPQLTAQDIATASPATPRTSTTNHASAKRSHRIVNNKS
jgi:hypothetical protein